MKSIIFITFYAILSISQTREIPKTILGGHQLTLEEAERILGEPAILKERTSDNQTDFYSSKSTFTAKEVDAKTQKPSNVYYMVERYKNTEEATKIIQSFIKSNRDNEGFELLTGYGDEAFFHNDKNNFCLLIIRKAHKMVRIKVNKVTSKTSFDALRTIGKDLMQRV